MLIRAIVTILMFLLSYSPVAWLSYQNILPRALSDNVNNHLCYAFAVSVALDCKTGLLSYSYPTFYTSIAKRLFLWACSKNNFTLINLLLGDVHTYWRYEPYVDKETVNGYSFPILKSAYENNNEELFDFLISKGAGVDSHVLTVACRNNDITEVKICLKAHCEIKLASRDQKNYYDGSKLIFYYQFPIDTACYYGNKEIVQLLLDHGVNINDRASERHILPLDFALSTVEGISIAEWLIDQGAQHTGKGLSEFLSDFEQDTQERFDVLTILCDLLIRNKLAIDKNRLITFFFRISKIKNDVQKNKLVSLLLSHFFTGDSCPPSECCFVLIRFNWIDDVHILKKIYACHPVILYQFFEACHEKSMIEFFDPNFVDEESCNTLLHIAAKKSLSLLITLMEKCVQKYTDQQLNILLKKRNAENKTFFYVAYEAGIIKKKKAQLPFFFTDNLAFLYQELCYAARVSESSNVSSFIKFCVQNGANLNERNRKGDRPLDIANKRYVSIHKLLPWSSKEFVSKEKIMHAFIKKTDYLSDGTIAIGLRSHNILDDIIKRILHYRHVVDGDYLMSKKLEDNSKRCDYYQKTKQQKMKFQQELIDSEDKKWGIVPEALNSQKIIRSFDLPFDTFL